MAKRNVAILGAGFWSHYQISAWTELLDARLIAICDADVAKAQALARRFGILGIYTDPALMLQEVQPDVVDIITSVPSHAPLVRLAIQQKVPVICQKPMAQTWAECQELVRLSQQAGIWFAIHENWRWQAPLRRVKQILQEGTIGTPFRCRIDMISGFDVFANQPNFRTDEQFIIADLGCHLLDLARSYFGEADSIYCRTSRIHADIRAEDVATILLSMNHGQTTVTVNMAYAGTPLENECFPQTLIFLEGSKGSIEVDPHYWVRVTTSHGTHSTRVKPPTYSWIHPDYACVQASLVDCHANLLNSLVTGHPAETAAADNLRSMQLVFAAYESARTGQVLPIGEAL